MNRYEAIIVAAGRSRRMGNAKPLLPLGEGTVLERTVQNFRDAGVEDILVVTGYRGEEVRESVAHLGVRTVQNDAYAETDMLASVRLGLSKRRAEAKGCLICPGDVPLILPETIRQVIRCMEEESCKIVVPTWEKEMGRPPLFSAEMVETLLKWRGEGGLRRFLEEHRESCRFLPVEDAMICQDMDTPADYRKLWQILELRGEKTERKGVDNPVDICYDEG